MRTRTCMHAHTHMWALLFAAQTLVSCREPPHLAATPACTLAHVLTCWGAPTHPPSHLPAPHHSTPRLCSWYLNKYGWPTSDVLGVAAPS